MSAPRSGRAKKKGRASKKKKAPYVPTGKPMGAEVRRDDAPTKDEVETADHVKRSLEAIVGGRLKATRQRRKRMMKREAETTEEHGGPSSEEFGRKMIMAYISESGRLREQRAARLKPKMTDYQIITVIGKGAFGEVRIVRDRAGEVWAMKTMIKKAMVAKSQMGHIVAERDLMAAADNPWLVKLQCAFQDTTYLYLVMEYCGGGDLMGLLIKKDILTERDTRFYMSELAAAINYVHIMGYVHRDLKPDNVLVANDGHIRLSDFGLAKSFANTNDNNLDGWQKYVATLRAEDMAAAEAAGAAGVAAAADGAEADEDSKSATEDEAKAHPDRKKLYSTVGTPDYIALEVLYQKGYDKFVDWWSLGVIMFECLVGYAPFHAKDPLSTCRKIVRYERYFKVPSDVKISRHATDLMKRLVCPSHRRLGWDQITKHAWFKKVPWPELMTVKPPFVPKLSSEVDASYFDAMTGDQDLDEATAAAEAAEDSSFFEAKVLGYTFQRGEVEALKKLGVDP